MSEFSDIIVAEIIKSKEAKIKSFPCHVNRASNIGHDCNRYLVYCRTHWDKRSMHDWKLQSIFDEGNLQEKAVEQTLREAGFELIEQQKAFQLKAQNITGHIDGKILYNGTAIPYESKSMAPHIWQSINSVEDMFESKYFWVRKYPAQMNIYLLGENKDFGVFILKNKSTGMIKVVDCYLDYDYAEKLLKKAEFVNECIESNNIPDPINEYSVCERCEFAHICMPDVGGVEMWDNEKVLDILDERQLLLSYVNDSEIPSYLKRLEAIKELLKKVFEGRERVMIGNYYVLGEWRNSAKGKYWRVSIVSGEET